jgi:ankyrin repeat protein
VVKELLSKGADINATDNDGRTALFWGIFLQFLVICFYFIFLFIALEKGDVESVKELVAHGAVNNGKSLNYLTALDKSKGAFILD